MAASRCGRCSMNSPASSNASRPRTILPSSRGAQNWATRLPPDLRLFGSTLGGCMLAGEALAARDLGEGSGDPQRYVTLARFFAENISVQAGALEKTVIDSADAVNAADAVLLA